MSTPHTCPACTAPLAEVDYVAHGYEETVYVCEGCDARYSPEDVLARQAEGEDAEAEGAEGDWAVVIGGAAAWVCEYRHDAEALAEWAVAEGGALTATVQAWDADGSYLPDDHGC
jgi:hypothetical protein